MKLEKTQRLNLETERKAIKEKEMVRNKFLKLEEVK